MSNCQVSLQSLKPHGEAPVHEQVLQATVRNTGDRPIRLNRARAACASLALEVRDAKGNPVTLPPPPVPDERLLGPGDELAPGAAVTFEYINFLDRSHEPGTYRVRFKAPSGEGSTADLVLASEWTEITVIRPSGEFPVGTAVSLSPVAISSGLLNWFRQFIRWISCVIRRLLGLRCDKVLEKEVDQPVTEVISNAPPGSEAWNGTYSWHSRFHLRVDEGACRATVTVRVRFAGGAITPTQQAALETAIQTKWNNKFKLCCDTCCCDGGYAIVTDVQFVNSGQHQTVNLGGSTTDMTHWAAGDTADVPHEFGHMLGAPDEYFTVNGTNYGPGRQAGSPIMNNPANNPVARNYDVIRDAVRGLLGTTCWTIGQNESC